MRQPETMLRVYEELADRFITQNEPRFRDHCLVLAADAALAADQPPAAERLRQRLLQHNPHHLLRPFGSMLEAMQAPDVQEYVADLRRQWPPEFVQKLYLGGRDAPVPVEPSVPDPPPAMPERSPRPLPQTRAVTVTVPAVSPPAPAQPAAPRRPQMAAPVAPTPTWNGSPVESTRPSPTAVWLATMLLFVGIAGAVGLLFIAFVWPLLD